jgi:hypothetical protein
MPLTSSARPLSLSKAQSEKMDTLFRKYDGMESVHSPSAQGFPSKAPGKHVEAHTHTGGLLN